MRKAVGGALAALALLAACQQTGGLSSSKGSPFAPGTVKGEDGVDGLLVGHRLMADRKSVV